jgi:hypothetical protein
VTAVASTSSRSTVFLLGVPALRPPVLLLAIYFVYFSTFVYLRQVIASLAVIARTASLGSVASEGRAAGRLRCLRRACSGASRGACTGQWRSATPSGLLPHRRGQRLLWISGSRPRSLLSAYAGRRTKTPCRSWHGFLAQQMCRSRRGQAL